jgi:hypothetical protein
MYNPRHDTAINAVPNITVAGKLTLDYNHPFGHATAAVGLGARPKASLALTTAVYTNFLLGGRGLGAPETHWMHVLAVYGVAPCTLWGSGR